MKALASPFEMPRLFLLVCLMLMTASTVAMAEPSLEAKEMAKTVPIADMHMHAYRRDGPRATEVLEQMDKNGVRWGGAVGDFREDVAKLLGSRYIPALGQAEFARVFFSKGEQALMDESDPIFQRLFAEAERRFADGTAMGFGELHTDNHTSGPMRMRRYIPTDNPVMRRFFTIANKYSGFVQIHTQLDARFNQDILRLTADFPNTKVILSHCLAGAQPADLRQLFEVRSNIYCELSAQGVIHNRLSGLSRPARVFSEERVRPDWLELFQQHPSRLMVGSDACCGWFSSYSEMIDEIRTNLFPHLEPELIERLAYKNAVTLFNLQ